MSEATTDAPELYRTLSLDEAAAYLHVHPETLRQRALSGRVPAAKPGRAWVFLLADLVEYLHEQQRQSATTRPGDGGVSSWGAPAADASVDAAYREALGLPDAGDGDAGDRGRGG